jgi:hypothetical protein
MLDNIPVFQKAIRTMHGWDISANEPLPYSTLLPWIRTLGEVTEFAQVTRPYSLRYGEGRRLMRTVRYAIRSMQGV